MPDGLTTIFGTSGVKGLKQSICTQHEMHSAGNLENNNVVAHKVDRFDHKSPLSCFQRGVT